MRLCKEIDKAHVIMNPIVGNEAHHGNLLPLLLINSLKTDFVETLIVRRRFDTDVLVIN